jgi:hypothetical protein
MILQRVITVAAAVFLVGAVTVALLGPPNIPLGAALYMVDSQALYALRAHAADWLWNDLAMPLLLRPAWLLPACIGIVLAGMSITLSSRQGPQRSPRRRL